MQQRCPNCGSPTAPGQRFCGGCGAQLSLACPQCRITVSPGTRFCPNCGAALGGGMPQQPGWGQQPGGMPPQQPGWGQQPGGMPPQQPGWGPQPGWAPPAPRSQSSSSRPFLVMLLIVLLIGLGFLTVKYTPLDETLLAFFKSATGGTGSAVDTTKPQISNVTPTAGTTSARIDWTTNEPASSQVEYGTTKEQTSLSELLHDPTGGASAGVVTHSVTLTGLTPSSPTGNIQYWYRVKSKDAAGNEAVSEWKTFNTALSDT
ncbi:MAG: hypothetical protein FJ005_04045 [Chloroflexi bacterium]|nr:hypothetical protein [Chloroflexota bacterium]